jgi:hypothetical protein
MEDIYNLYKTNPAVFVNTIIKDKDNKKLLTCCKKKGNSLLHILIDEEDIDGFKSLICMLKELKSTNKCLVKKIINKKNKKGDTPAHIAVRKSKNENNTFSIMVEALHSLGADFTIPNNNNEVIKKLSDMEYDSEHTKIKKYINSCLFGESFDLDIHDNNYKKNIESDNNFYDIGTSSPLILELFVNKSNNQIKQTGGGKKKYSDSESVSSDLSDEVNGKRIIYNPYISMKGGSKKSQEIHDEIINRIKEMKYNDQDAQDIKNVIYYEVKHKYPELNNNERAEKMLEVIDKKLKKIDINEIRKELEKYRERRNSNMEPKKELKKEPKKTSKKEPKRQSKKSSKKSSKRSKK